MPKASAENGAPTGGCPPADGRGPGLRQGQAALSLSNAGRQAKPRRLRWRRVLLWGSLAVVAAAVIVLSSPYWFPTEWLRRRLDEELERALPVKASVGELSVRLGLGLRARWRDLALVSEASGARLGVSAESGEVEVPLTVLFGGRLRVPTVTLETVRASLRVGPEGLRPLLSRWQAKQSEREARAQAEEKAGTGRRRPSFEVKNVLISDLVFSLVDEQGQVLERTPNMDLGVEVKSLVPADVRLSVNGHTFVAEASLSQSGNVTGGISDLQGIDLQRLFDSLRLLVSPDTPRVSGLVQDGEINFAREGDLLTVDATGTLGHLEVESTGTGTLSAARLQVPQVRVVLRLAKDHLECTLDRLAVDAEGFDFSLPPGAAPSVLARVAGRGVPPAEKPAGPGAATPSEAGPPATFHFAGRRLTGALAGSAKLSPEQVTGSVHALEPIRLVEASLAASGERPPAVLGPGAEAAASSGDGVPRQAPAGRERRSLPLATVAEAWLSGAAAEATWGAGEPVMVSLSGQLGFREASAGGLLDQLAAASRAPGLLGRAPAATVAPLDGDVDFRATNDGVAGEAHLRSRSLSVKGQGVDVAVGPWELRTKFSVAPSKNRLQLSEALWRSEQLSLTGSLADVPISLGAASSALSGSLSILPDGEGWSVASSGEGTLSSLSLQARDGEAVSADSLQVTGSVGGTYTDRKPHLTVLDATASVLGGRANERVLALVDVLPPGLRSVGVALAGDAEAELKYDGRWLDVSASATGREVALSAPKLFGPSPLRLNNLGGEVAVRLAPDLSEVILNQCQLESPELEASARGVVCRAGATYSLQLIGRLATSWSALGPSWVALAEALPAKLHDALVRFRFEGRASLEDVVIKGPLNQLSLAGEVNLDGSAVRFDEELLKEVGTRGRMPLRLALGERVRLEDLALDLEGLPRVQVAGDTDRELSQTHFAVAVTRLEQAPLKEVRPELAQLALSGGLTVEGFLENVRENGTGWARFHFDHLGVEVAGPEPVRLEVDGTLSVTPASISCDDLRVTVDGSDLHISGRLEGYLRLLARLAQSPEESAGGPSSPTPLPVGEGEGEAGAPQPLEAAPGAREAGATSSVESGRERVDRLTGAGSAETLPQLRADVRAEVLDLTRYEGALLGSGPPVGGGLPAGVAGAVVELTPPTVVELVPLGGGAPAAGAREAGAATEPGAAGQVAIDGKAVVDALSHWLPRLGVELAGSGSVEAAEVRTSRATLEDFKAAWRLTDGVLRVDVCEGRMAGGEFDAAGTEVHLDRWPPSYTCIYRSFDLEAEPDVVTMVSRRFPGLSFAGHMDDEGTFKGLASADPGEWASSVSGWTRTILTDGVLLIPLPIPAYVHQLFPSLSPSAYHFTTMTNEATIKQGVWSNIMKFDGYPELYIAGTTDADGRIDYEAGLRILKTVAGPAGRLVADVGRFPVSHFTGRIRGTEFVELEGAFATLPELVSRLLADGLYQGFKKGVLDLGYLRSFQETVPIPGLDLFISGLDFVLDVTIRLIPGLGKEKPEPQPEGLGGERPAPQP